VTLQRELLDSAIAALRPGGLLAYVTCSPHLDETSAQVEAFADGSRGMVPVDARPSLPGVAELGPGPAVQLWPHVHDTDAMYLAMFRRS
jgi:16S rRNA (cytosine967-C5)-methyltransferase